MKTTDWARLVELRERRLRQAQEIVARDQRALRAADAELHAAMAEQERRIAFRHEQSQALIRSVTAGVAVITQLREAGAYRRLLDALVEKAGQAVAEAQARQAERAEVVRISLRALHAALAELRAAEEMQSRVRREWARLRDLRAEDQLDETARERWQSRQGLRATRSAPAA
jgi:hypothetical protein